MWNSSFRSMGVCALAHAAPTSWVLPSRNTVGRLQCDRTVAAAARCETGRARKWGTPSEPSRHEGLTSRGLLPILNGLARKANLRPQCVGRSLCPAVGLREGGANAAG